jgi:hypothetical protein
MPLEDLAVSASGFLFDPGSGATFTTNPAGALLLEGLRRGDGLAALVDLARSRFDVSEADVARDVLEFVRTLQAERLLPADFELGA